MLALHQYPYHYIDISKSDDDLPITVLNIWEANKKTPAIKLILKNFSTLIFIFGDNRDDDDDDDGDGDDNGGDGDDDLTIMSTMAAYLSSSPILLMRHYVFTCIIILPGVTYISIMLELNFLTDCR